MDAVENDPASYQPVSLICRVYLTGKLTRMPPVLRGESVEQLRLVAPQQRGPLSDTSRRTQQRTPRCSLRGSVSV